MNVNWHNDGEYKFINTSEKVEKDGEMRRMLKSPRLIDEEEILFMSSSRSSKNVEKGLSKSTCLREFSSSYFFSFTLTKVPKPHAPFHIKSKR